MARPKEEGLKYFPFDIDFFNDEKIEAISGEFGIKGEIATIKLLCAVYRNGYFIEWNEMLKMKLLKNLPGVSLDLLEQIINRLVKWEFFDKNLFDSVKILTSHGVQKRYFEAIRRRRQSKDYPYILIDGVCGCESKDALSSVDDNNSNSDEIVKCKVNVCNNPTSTDINVGNNATKESKGKEEEYIPPIIPQGGMRDSDDNMIQIEQELKSREAELLAKEQKLLKREAALKNQLSNKLPDISFVSDDFKDVFSSWLEYKREKKESYKSNKALEACYKKLLELSNNNPDIARLIVEQSMASNWSGIFELRNGNNGKGAFSPNGSSTAGQVIKPTENRQSGETPQKDYSQRF